MVITFPHIGNVYITAKVLLDTLNIPYVIPPFSNDRTIELGSKYVNDSVCLPLKINIGNFLQAKELGADTIIMTGGKGPCRAGYYGEMYSRLLKEIGADMEVITLEAPDGNIKALIERVKKLCGGRINGIKLARGFNYATKICILVDEIERLTFKTRAYEINKGSTNDIYKWFRNRCYSVRGYDGIVEICKATNYKLKNIPLNMSVNPFKVGIVGEIFTTIDQYTNFNIASLLGDMGVLVSRPVTLSNWLTDHMIKKAVHLPVDKTYENEAKPYIKEMIGGHAQETIGNTISMAKAGYDGVIQVYPLNCMPEIVSQGILKKVSKDFNIPIMTMIIDEMTGEEGFITRIEAFVDLLKKRRESSLNDDSKILLGN